jgi:hypothetical protein
MEPRNDILSPKVRDEIAAKVGVSHQDQTGYLDAGKWGSNFPGNRKETETSKLVRGGMKNGERSYHRKGKP